MIITLVPALFAVLGILLYVLATNAKVVELGRLTFACGFLVTMATLSSKAIHLFSAVLIAAVALGIGGAPWM